MSSATQQHSRKHANRACMQKVRAKRSSRWARPLWRLFRALDSTERLIASANRVVAVSRKQRSACPVRTSQKLDRASGWMANASNLLLDVGRSFDETTNRALAASQYKHGASGWLAAATANWLAIAVRLEETSEQISALQRDLLDGLESGRLVPEPIEPPADRRPRIIVRIPHLILAARAFLKQRRSSVRDRIASVPVRRRRQALVVVTDAPRRISRGRAPPSSDCRF